MDVSLPAGANPPAGADAVFDAGRASPMIAQYQALKRAHPGALLFFRMGDFYELFFEDALVAAPALEIALTKRGRHAGEDIPMCGVPIHNAELYLHRLIRKGFKVAICEQLEDPAEARKRGGKSLVKRDVIRIVTPGTLTEDALLDARSSNYLVAVAASGGELALAWVDISTGAFWTEAVERAGLPAALARLSAGEILVPERLFAEPTLAGTWREAGEAVTPLPDASFDSIAAERRLCQAFKVATLEGFGGFGRAELAAAGAILGYLELTQKGLLPRLDRPRRLESRAVLQIDPATRRNLELVTSLSGSREGSLLAAIDRTVTNAGGRLLCERLSAPLARPEPIRARLDEVESFVESPDRRADVREALRRCPDLGRALSRLSLGRGGPRDLLAVARGLEQAGALRDAIGDEPALAGIARRLVPLGALVDRLVGSLEDEVPLLARDGGFIRVGRHEELDQLRNLRDQSRRHIAALEEHYRRETGISSLKIRHNNLLGYYVEVPASQLGKVPASFVQRQSMAGATRYSTKELAELESRIASAGDRALALELELFESLRQEVLAEGDAIAVTAQALAELDVAAALAELAVEQRYVRPVVDESASFAIVGGRHPVVEQALARGHDSFVANDCDLGPSRALWLLTGPNMAGKSTFLRQNALITVLAQMGSFVPASSARIGVVDRLFSRVGAADDLARGRSTFMVEMVETAGILNLAGPRSLVILDEIGRGTATYDGLSLAWAVVEHLHDVNRCRGLFATHYHELTALASRLERLSCHTLRVKEWQGQVVFLHEVAPGTADRSYGIHVARLAGLPEAVLRRAEEVLHRLEEGEARSAPAKLADDLPLFAAALRPTSGPACAGAEPSEIERILEDVVPDELTPKDALELVYRLKKCLVEREPRAHIRSR
ncbi:DNA mismatch repair protein MutS [Benzoatithermus flavus]|uniref:DNA mismatch repair protein MutS n=1 Tax=Benzoatithermus flavus TaxID=3108223 RepID=A0ABU8XX00_9PROT